MPAGYIEFASYKIDWRADAKIAIDVVEVVDEIRVARQCDTLVYTMLAANESESQ